MVPVLSIKHFIPDINALRQLTLEERARLLLQFLQHANRTQLPVLNRSHLLQPHYFFDYEAHERVLAIASVADTWSWLEQNRLIAPIPGQQMGWIFITPHGELLANAANIAAYRAAVWLPAERMHPAIVDNTKPDFMRGDYQRAVFQAFKEVETAVRETTGDHFMDAVPLMRKAFARGRGALTNPNDTEEVQHGLLLLMTGAMAYFRRAADDPSHVLPAEEVVEILLFASHLRRIVDQRASAK